MTLRLGSFMQWRGDTTLLSRGLYQGRWTSRVKPPNDRLGSARQMSVCTSGGTTRNPLRDLLVRKPRPAACHGNLAPWVAALRVPAFDYSETSPPIRSGSSALAPSRE